MNRHSKRLYGFGPFRVDTAERTLLCNERPVPLTPKVFDTLLALVENTGHVLGKNELMQKVWPDSFVEENNLAQNISILRKVLGEGAPDGLKYIETVPKRGYRFVADVEELWDEQGAQLIVRERTRARVLIEEETEDETGQDPPSVVKRNPAVIDLLPGAPTARESAPAHQLLPHLPETRYARSGDVNIAYQVVGDGALDLVFVMGWVSHLEYFWREPSFAQFLLRLASFSRLILFDKRGTGLSDRVPITELPTLEQRMDDVRAVMDAVGSTRAALCGVSEGGPMCSLFAATYPEKTIAVVMIGTYAKRIWASDYPWAPTMEARQEFYEEMQRDWGGPVGIEERAPSVADDPQFREWWATYLRMGASPGAALALTKMNADIDVRHVLPSIRVPTLVIHRAGDACLKVEEGRYVAEKIPGAKYVELPGVDHLPFVGDQDAILDEIEEFLTGVRHAPEHDRVLATVLFTRITEEDEGEELAAAASLRERPSGDLLERHQAHVRRQLELFKGREIEMKGGQLLATFDGPARAIRAASAISDFALRLGLKIKAGLHTGECDVIDDHVGGIAVGIGAQVAAKANVGEVLVSHTVKDLVAGSGIRFEERGALVLDEIPGKWGLFAVERTVARRQ
ncbi:MAG TPA: alpha/beta fold hydrolase [Pyrinomonadaceae bacterium]|jgi:pimeloyl-ACP methyl ester carboxylesterase/DNA-binding winged helix-turn-helix (wHTH) protein/class 3 adenylate cyclase